VSAFVALTGYALTLADSRNARTGSTDLNRAVTSPELVHLAQRQIASWLSSRDSDSFVALVSDVSLSTDAVRHSSGKAVHTWYIARAFEGLRHSDNDQLTPQVLLSSASPEQAEQFASAAFFTQGSPIAASFGRSVSGYRAGSFGSSFGGGGGAVGGSTGWTRVPDRNSSDSSSYTSGSGSVGSGGSGGSSSNGNGGGPGTDATGSTRAPSGHSDDRSWTDYYRDRRDDDHHGRDSRGGANDGPKKGPIGPGGPTAGRNGGNGSVTQVPEPSSMLLVALGLAGVTAARRRRV
jgi:hypothetical protein